MSLPSIADHSASRTSRRIRLRVISAQGKQQSIELQGISEAEAVRKMALLGSRVLSIESVVDVSLSEHGRGGNQFPLLLFSQELLALLEAGLNLTEALTTLHAKEHKSFARKILGDILQALKEGKNFSDVLAMTPHLFPEVYVATVRASERTGDLPRALARYIAYQAQFDGIRKKLISAAIYPVMLLIVGGMVTLFLLGYVVPKFSAVYESTGRDMPWLSAMLLAFGRMIYEHWQWALFALFLIVGGMVWALSQASGRRWLLEQVLRIPWLAQRAKEFRLARFYRAVSLLLAAGIALPKAMQMVTGLLSGEQQQQLTQCRTSVEEGRSLSVSLVEAGLANPVAESLIKVGERSGQLGEMLERTALFADEEFSRWVDWSSRLLEPVLMTLIGLVIGTVVILMYIPIFDLAGSLQ